MQKRKLKRWVKDTLIGMAILGVIMFFIILSNIIAKDEIEHIKRVSAQCAEQGKGIEPYYTKEGDKFFKCVQ